MKKILLFIFFSLFILNPLAAQTNPTLAVGLETLTMNKGTIDVELLTKIIMQKQKELKQEALKRFMYELFPETNFTTRYYIQNCLNVLLNEKNPQVIEKEILEHTTNYALSLGVTVALLKWDDKEIVKVSKAYQDYKFFSQYHQDKLMSDRRNYFKHEKKINTLKSEITKHEKELAGHIKNYTNINQESSAKQEYEKISTIKKNLVKKRKRLTLLILKKDLIFKDDYTTNKTDSIPFGILQDVVSLSLSEIPELQKKGFFKNKIDYRNSEFYSGLNDNEIKFKETLMNLDGYIRKMIKPYISNYDIIKEYLKKNKEQEANDIKNELIKENLKEITHALKTSSKLSNKIKNITKLKDLNEESNDLNSRIISYEKEIKKNEKLINLLETIKFNKNASYQSKDSIITLKTKIEQLKIKLTDIRKEDNTKNISEIDRLIKHIPVLITNDSIVSVSEPIEIKQFINEIDTLRTQIKKKSDTYRAAIINLSTSLAKNIDSIAKTDDFYNAYLKLVLIELRDNDNIKFQTKGLDTLTIYKASKAFSEIYLKLKSLINNSDIKMQDIIYFENYVTEKMIELKTRDHNNDEIYDAIIKNSEVIVPLLKNRALLKIDGQVKYDEELISLFEFVSNLNKLDKAETYQSIIDLLRDGSEKVKAQLADGKFKDTYILFINAMKKYTLINTTNEYVEVDVISFLNDLQQYYNRNNKSVFSLYLTLGINQNFFFENFKFPDSDSKINNISFASEKIGLKSKIHSFKSFSGYTNVIKDDVHLNKKAPFFNEVYGIIYGSGLLYSLANTTTNENFDFPHLGLGFGLRFYNALDFNLTLGFPFINNRNFGDNAFWGIGFDIPLGEYLEALGNKNK